MPFSLASLDVKAAAERGLVVEFRNPADPTQIVKDETGKPLTITILGHDAEKIKERDRKTLDKIYERVAKGTPQQSASKKSEQESIDRLAAATVAWSDNWVLEDGQPALVCTEANAKKLYGDPRFPWIAEQLLAKIDDRTAFFTQGSDS